MITTMRGSRPGTGAAIIAAASCAIAVLFTRIAMARVWQGDGWQEPPAANIVVLAAVALAGVPGACLLLVRPGAAASVLVIAWAAAVAILAILLSVLGHNSAVVAFVLAVGAGLAAFSSRPGTRPGPQAPPGGRR